MHLRTQIQCNIENARNCSTMPPQTDSCRSNRVPALGSQTNHSLDPNSLSRGSCAKSNRCRGQKTQLNAAASRHKNQHRCSPNATHVGHDRNVDVLLHGFRLESLPEAQTDTSKNLCDMKMRSHGTSLSNSTLLSVTWGAGSSTHIQLPTSAPLFLASLCVFLH